MWTRVGARSAAATLAGASSWPQKLFTLISQEGAIDLIGVEIDVSPSGATVALIDACLPMQKRRQSLLIMQRSLSSILFPGYRRSVLSLLFLGPDRSLHGREISRRTGLPAGTLTRELNLLADVGLLKKEKRGNQLLYSANRTSPVFDELSSILRKTSGLADVLSSALNPLSKQIQVAFIFGSLARGTESAGSDVDVLIIGPIDFGSVIDAFHPSQKQLAREINPKVFSSREWKAKLRVGNQFVMNVMKKPKIFLIGGKDELEEFSRHKP
jgi:predicted nucleotidyltransferase